MPPHILFRNSNTLVIHFIQISFSDLAANRGIYYNCEGCGVTQVLLGHFMDYWHNPPTIYPERERSDSLWNIIHSIMLSSVDRYGTC